MQNRDRLKEQGMQLQDDLLQQMHEKGDFKLRKDETESARHGAMLVQHKKGMKRDEKEQSDCKKEAVSLRDDNIFLAWQQNEKKLNSRAEEEKKDRREIEFSLYGDQLTENPNFTKSVTGPHRVLPDRLKEMDKDQHIDYNGQKSQITPNQAWQQTENKKFNSRAEEKDKRDDQLSVNPNVAKCVTGPHRVLSDKWKGINKDQPHIYYDGQKSQITPNQERKEREQEENGFWEDHFHRCQDTYRSTEELERKNTLKLNKELEFLNIELAEEQKEQLHFFNTVTNVNVPSEDYFNQFSKGGR